MSELIEVILNEEDQQRFLDHLKKNSINAWFEGQKFVMPSGQGRTAKGIVLCSLEVFKMQQTKIDELHKQIDEISQSLIDKADKDASDPYMYENKRAYFQGISDGLNSFRHSIGLSDDVDKELTTST